MSAAETKTMLLTADDHYPYHRRRHHHRNCTAIFFVTVAVLIAIPLWLSLVFSSSTAFSFLSLPPLSSPHRYAVEPFPTSLTSSSVNLTAFPSQNTPPLSLDHIVFGIASSARLWPRRSEYLRLWWRPGYMRGDVWIDEYAKAGENLSSLPSVRVSEDSSRFIYTNPTGNPSGLRIARIIAESFRLGYQDVRWFLLCDDDTIVNPENLVLVLAKYDWREMVYVGGSSESHLANTYFSHSMAFGGAGIAISYPLASALAEMEDECLERYPKLYGSDDRLHACISELGVPLSREIGFHQWDVRGNAHGLLAAHPITPFVSIHHVEAVNPLYPGLSSLDSLKLFTRAMRIQPLNFLQHAICYDKKRQLTFLVSLGYIVQVFPGVILPRDLERSEQTYIAWNWKQAKDEFDFDTRDTPKSLCKKPVQFFLRDIKKNGNHSTGSYLRHKGRSEFKRKIFCFPQQPPLPGVEEILVLAKSLDENWILVPRRLCCQLSETSNKILTLVVGQCESLDQLPVGGTL